jgi:hypothetical protein
MEPQDSDFVSVRREREVGRKLSDHGPGFYLMCNFFVVRHFSFGIPQQQQNISTVLLGSLAVPGKVSLEISNRCPNLYAFVILFGALTGSLFHQIGAEFPPACRERSNGYYIFLRRLTTLIKKLNC